MDPSATGQRQIALLRGINVGGRHRIQMATLRDLCGELGWSDVETYIQSGNVVFTALGAAAALETQLEQGIGARFGFHIPVIVRAAHAWSAIAAGNPFPDVTAREPQLVMLLLAQRPPLTDAVERLRERANTERIERMDDAIWIHYAGGAGRSKLTPAFIDRCAGSPATARNWRTVLQLGTMTAAR